VESTEPARETEGQGDPDDPVGATKALLDVVLVCASQEDLLCEGAVASGSAGVVEALRAPLSASDPPVAELVDAYGDIAVIRLSPAGAGSEEATGELMLVLVRMKDEWLVRAVYGVADQPG
jgi:hypothetical protein